MITASLTIVLGAALQAAEAAANKAPKGVSLTTVLAYALLPTAAVIIGGAAAAWRRPSDRVRSIVQHIAAGVVFAAVAAELLPEEKNEHEPLALIIGFAVGVALMLALGQLPEGPVKGTGGASGAAPASTGGANALLIVVGIDLAIDGLLVGIGFEAAAQTGVLVTVALTLEVAFLAMATGAKLVQSGWANRKVVGAAIGLAVPQFVGAGVGALLAGSLSGFAFAAVLGFGIAALLYLVTEELLVEAHEVPETPITAALFFAGFLTILVIDILAS